MFNVIFLILLKCLPALHFSGHQKMIGVHDE